MAKKRARYHHGNLRETLVSAAAEITAEAGLESLTLRMLSERVGVSRTAPYRHFADKAALLAVYVSNETELESQTNFLLDTFITSENLKKGQVHLVEDISSLLKPTLSDQILQREGISGYANIHL